MTTQIAARTLGNSLTTGRRVQAAWLAFLLLALSLALPGIAPYRQLLQTVCTGDGCITGQLSPQEAWSITESGDTLLEYADLALMVYLFAAVLALITAGYLIWRKSAYPPAASMGFALAALSAATLAQAAATTYPALHLPAQLIGIVPIAAATLSFCLIPDGRFHPGWLRWGVPAAMTAGALATLGVFGAAMVAAIQVGIAALIVGSLITRYRSLPSSPQQEQVTWALAAFALFAGVQWIGRPLQWLPLPALPVSAFPLTYNMFMIVFGLLLFIGGLTCVAVALLGDELFRVEVALNRALVYSLLTLFVIGGYALVVGYLSLVFQSQGSLWFSLIATGLVAVLFQPIRVRVQRAVDRLLYGERDDPYKVVAQFGQRLEDTLEPGAIPTAIAETVRASLHLPYAALTLELNGATEMLAESGASASELICFPLINQGATVGNLLVSPRRGDAGLNAADRALLTDLALQAGVAIHGVRLLNDLQQSRERLVLAREEERRRLRRDLHDDLAPTLAGLSLRAGAISDLILTDPIKAQGLADGLVSAIRDAVGDIRRLVYDLRPPALDDLGLLGAIRERAADYSLGSAGAPGLTGGCGFTG